MTASSRKVNFHFVQSLGQPSSDETLRDNSIDSANLHYQNGCILFPLKKLLHEVTQQEHQLWDKTHGVHIPVEEGGSRIDVIEEELLSVGGGSVPSIEPSMTYLIRYGQLTKVIHRYFRKLEKEHACLYLSGRRANFENLRLHQNHTSLRTTPIPRVEEALSVLSSVRRDVHSLRDEELLVYRCALMCANFPMLSAPSPPDGRSPSPPPLPLHLLSQTAPSESSIVMATLSSANLAQKVSSTDRPQNTSTPTSESDPATCSISSQQDVNPNCSIEGTDHQNEMMADTHKRVKSPRNSTGSRRSRQRRSYSFSDSDSEEMSRVSLTKSTTSQLLERDQPFPPMVNRDMMCTLVRRAFHQTEEQQMQCEQILRHEYGRKSKGEILARELVAQLQVLENNAHPFYKPRNFVTRNGYDIWLQAEKQRLRDQLDKFWHFNLPKPQVWPIDVPVDHHKAYVTLLEKIICVESRSTRREPVHGGRTPSSPLSPTAQRLLIEFGLRYGVGELYQHIVYLDYLAKHFDYEIWYIQHCTNELKAIRALLPRNRTKTTATRREMELLRNAIHHIHGQTDNSLTRIDRLFQDSDPQLGVASLIDLLKEVLDAEQSLFGQRIRPMDEWLKRYLKYGFALRYERKKEIISNEISSVQNMSGLSPILINALLLGIREEVKEYKDQYQAVFRTYFNIVPFAKKELYRLVCSDACTLCGRMVHDPESRLRLNLEMVGLLYRLNERDIDWSNEIPTEMQLWRNQFVHLALVWIDVLAKQINQWVLLALREDQWTVLTFAAHTPRSPSMDLRDDHHQSLALPLQASQLHVSPFCSNISAFVPHSQSAFSAVESNKSYRDILSPMSEVSGAVSELSSSHSSFESLSVEVQQQSNSKDKSIQKKSKNTTFLKFGRNDDNIHLEEETLDHNGTIPISVSPSVDNMTPIVSPQVAMDREESTTEEEEDVKSKPFPVIVSATIHSDELIENGFSSSPPITPPLAVPPSYRRLTSENSYRKVLPKSKEEKTEKVEKLLSKSFDELPRPPGKLSSQPPSISVVMSKTRPLFKPPVDSLDGGQGPSSTTSISTDHSESPSIQPRSTPCSISATDVVYYFFPISNSPIDLVTIYVRLASFVGNILSILTPKIRQGFKPSGLNVELPDEVNQVRRRMTDIHQQSETMRSEFLRKVHRTMFHSLKLYADNLICMDLCYLPQGEANHLFGEDTIHHLKRRNETGEIWGCRHLVEAKHDLHPDGLPCLNKTQSLFESITRDMCIRVNNIHMIITILPELESHLYTLTLSPSSHTPFGHNLSSETSSGLHPDKDQSQTKSQQPLLNRHRPEARRQQPLKLLPQENGSDTTNTTNSMGTPISRHHHTETGFYSAETQQLIEYLEGMQKKQIEMICLRMNRFFKPALSLLLDLKLGDCPIDRRLHSIVSFLLRHMNALSKLLYQQCFDILMKLLWRSILQDVEDEALLLRTKKNSSYRANLLLQTVTYLIKVIHNEGNGLSLEILTSSSEYLLALLDVFLRPTSRLIKVFEKLTGPQFTQVGTQIQLDKCPVPITSQVLNILNLQLHTFKKCFTGKEFVDKLVKLGHTNELDISGASSEREGGIAYSGTSAVQLGQYLLNEGILICLLNYDNDHRSTPLESSSSERMNAVDTTRHAALVDHKRQPSPVRAESVLSDSSLSPTPPPSQPPQFKSRTDCWYKFSDLEDSLEGSFLKRAQILSVCSRPPHRTQLEHNCLSEFDQARYGTLYLLLDVFQQRSRKDQLAKEFLQQPNVILASQQRTANDISCHKIFRI